MKLKPKVPAFIGRITIEMCSRTDMSELSICRNRPERCSLLPGEHDRQEAAESERLMARVGHDD